MIPRAIKHTRNFFRNMEYRFYALVITCLAKIMRSVNRIARWLELIDKPPRRDLIKHVRSAFLDFAIKFCNLALKISAFCLNRREVIMEAPRKRLHF